MPARPGRFFFALLLIFIGICLLAVQLFPLLRMYALNGANRALLPVAVGGVLLLAAVLTWSPRLMVPASVIGGIGGILYWQNATGDWASWSYMWTLLPGLVGAGVLLMHLMQGEWRQGIVSGGIWIAASAAAFFIFSSWQGAFTLFGPYWPLLLVLPGVLLLAQTFLRPRG